MLLRFLNFNVFGESLAPEWLSIKSIKRVGKSEWMYGKATVAPGLDRQMGGRYSVF